MARSTVKGAQPQVAPTGPKIVPASVNQKPKRPVGVKTPAGAMKC